MNAFKCLESAIKLLNEADYLLDNFVDKNKQDLESYYRGALYPEGSDKITGSPVLQRLTDNSEEYNGKIITLIERYRIVKDSTALAPASNTLAHNISSLMEDSYKDVLGLYLPVPDATLPDRFSKSPKAVFFHEFKKTLGRNDELQKTLLESLLILRAKYGTQHKEMA